MPVKKCGYYTLSILTGTWSTPLDSTVYYFGKGTSGVTTTQGQNPIKIPKAGSIRTCQIYAICWSGETSSENWSLYVRVNNTTDYLIATVGAATSQKNWDNLALNIPVSAGDYIEIKTTTPAWATNPGNVTLAGNVLIQCA